MADLLAQQLHTFVRGHDHLAQHWFLFLQLCGLLLEIGVFLFLGGHTELQISQEGFDEWGGGFINLFVDVEDLRFHGVEFLSEELHQFVVLLQIFIRFTCEILRER